MNKNDKIALNVLELMRCMCFTFLIAVMFLIQDDSIILSLFFWIPLTLWITFLFADRTIRIKGLEERVDKLEIENNKRIWDNERLKDKIEYLETTKGE